MQLGNGEDNPTRDLWEVDPSLASHAMGAISEGILIVDALTPSYPVIWANQGFERLTGFTGDEILGRSCGFLQGPNTDPIVAARISDALERGESCEAVIRNYRRDGSPFWSAVSIHPVPGPDGRPIRFIWIQSDVTASVEAAERADREERLDPVTGLPGQQAFLERIAQALVQVPQSAVTVFHIDLDGFRRVNAEHGHQVGDELLFSTARRLLAAAGSGDIIARAGADEFLVLSIGLERPSEVVERAQSILAAFDDPFELGGVRLSVAASIGVATASDSDQRPSDLVAEAEAALRRAPRGSRRFELFDAELRERIRIQGELGLALAQALRQDELSVAFQPIVDLGSGRIVAFEALARWHHPELGTVPPQTFVGVAEETGSSDGLLHRVLEHAGADFARIAAADPTGEVGLAFNVSPTQLHSGSLLEGVAGLIERTGIEPRRIVVEIAEDALTGGAEGHLARVSELRDLGVRIALDDFGTASTSISQLRSLPIDQLKLDRSFVSGLDGDTADAALAASLLPMARALEIEVVAEGIETDQHLAHLFALGYRLGQGFRFAIAVPVGAALELIGRSPMLVPGAIPAGDQAEVQERFCAALVAGDARRADDIVRSALAAGIGAMAIQTDIIGSALHWIGSEWEAGRLGVADEHLATAICERQLATVLETLRTGRRRTRFTNRVLLAAVDGERHAVGLKMTANALDAAGFETVFLGADLPPEALADAVGTHGPVAVCLSLSSRERRESLDAALDLLACCEPAPIVLVGGSAVGVSSELRRGAIAATSPSEALAILREQLGIVEPAPAEELPGQAQLSLRSG